MTSFCTTLLPCLSEAVAGADNDSAIRISHETQRSGFSNTMLINLFFGKVHAFNTHFSAHSMAEIFFWIKQ